MSNPRTGRVLSKVFSDLSGTIEKQRIELRELRDHSTVLIAELDNARARIAELEREAGAARRERAAIVKMLKNHTSAGTSPGVHHFCSQLLKIMEKER